MTAILVIFFVLVYILSICGMIHIYSERDIDICFWGFVLALIPVVNTIVFIVIYDDWDGIKNFFSLKKFINDLKDS